MHTEGLFHNVRINFDLFVQLNWKCKKNYNNNPYYNGVNCRFDRKIRCFMNRVFVWYLSKKIFYFFLAISRVVSGTKNSTSPFLQWIS
jgi:hypothetical protein